MKPYADLHIHTSLSDGSALAGEAITAARDHDVSFISITDHNTVAAYSETTWQQAESAGVCLLPGVELDVIHQGKQYHLLGFGVDCQNSLLLETCAHNTQVQEAYNLSLLRQMEKDGLGVSEKAYHAYAIPQGRGGWKLLNYLLDAGMTNTLLEGTKFYGQYGFSPHTIGFVSLEETVRIVRQAGGVPILAHPAEQIPYNPYAPSQDAFWAALEELLQTGIEGVECIHPLHGFGLQAALLSFCHDRGLYISGGTDYHGAFFHKQKQVIGGQLIAADTVQKLISRCQG